MADYFIKDAEGNILNTIKAELDFVAANYEFYEEVPEREFIRPDTSLEEEARRWRDSELKDTDWIVPITDYPQYSDYIIYRQALRDWPSTEDFPETKPTLGG